jgi:hypothetical protein
LLPLLILSSSFSQKKKKEKNNQTNSFAFIALVGFVVHAKQGLDNFNPI